MLKINILAATAIVVLSATSTLACTSADVEAKQGALITAVQNLMAVDPAKAQAIVVQMQAELEAAAATGDDTAVCDMMDRLTAEATG